MKKQENGVSIGRPKINDLTKQLVIRLYQEDEMECADIAKACNISRASLFRIIKEWREADGKEKAVTE